MNRDLRTVVENPEVKERFQGLGTFAADVAGGDDRLCEPGARGLEAGRKAGRLSNQ